MQEMLTAGVRTAMAPLNRGSMTRRAFGYLQNVKPEDSNKTAKMLRRTSLQAPLAQRAEYLKQLKLQWSAATPAMRGRISAGFAMAKSAGELKQEGAQ